MAADLQKFVGPPLWNDSIEHFFQLRHQPPLSSQHIDGGNDRSDAGDDESSYDTGDGDTSQYDETDSYAGTEEGDMDEE